MNRLYQLIRQDLSRVGIQIHACSQRPDLIGFLENLHTKVDKKIDHYYEVNEKLYGLIEKKVIIDKAIRALKNALASAVIYGC